MSFAFKSSRDILRIQSTVKWYETIGRLISSPSQIGINRDTIKNGPFSVTKSKKGSSVDDQLLIGKHRSAEEPGVVFLGEVGKTFDASEEVELFGSEDTQLLCLQVKVTAGGGGLDHEYVWKELADIPALQAASAYTYFPLAWVKSVSSGGKYIAKRIRWPNTEWLMTSKGSSIAPVQLTTKVDDTTYTGSVYANGRHNTATEAGITIKVGALAAGETLPTQNAWAWFVAHKENWDVAGVDTSLWTIQPEILR